MGGETFFKAGGGHKCTSKNYRTFLWFELATVTSQALKYDVITGATQVNSVTPAHHTINQPSF